MPLKLGGLVILCALMLFAGCGRIRVIEAPQVPEMPTAGTPLLADLAITSVDFDPALHGNQLSFSGSYTVLAAVENRGRHTQRDIMVNAQLLQADAGTLVFSRTVAISELAPGAVTIVKLGPEHIPQNAGPDLRLVVKGIPTGSDHDLSNNQREFVIQVGP